MWSSINQNIINHLINTMKKLLGSALVFSALLAISSVVSAQSIPPAPPIVPGGTNYEKCLNIALLKRDTGSQKTYQVFNAAIQTQTDSLNQAVQNASRIHGWLSWLGWFFKPSQESMDRITKADQDMKTAIAQNSPARDSALASINTQFSTDKQYCMTHQNQTYEWTTDQQNSLNQFEGKGNKPVTSTIPAQQPVSNNPYSDSNQPPMPQPDANTIQLTILSPKTGDVWAQGYPDQQTISWSSRPIPQSNTIVETYIDGPSQYEGSYQTSGIGSTYSHKAGAPVMSQGKNFQPSTYRLKVTVYGSIEKGNATKLVMLAQGVSGYFKIVPESQSTVRYVSVSISGHGSVLSTGGISPSINCPDPFTNSSPRGCTVAYPLNQTVTLTALPTPGYKFDGWSGDCSGNLNCIVTVSGEKTIQAMFSSGQSENQPAI